MVEGAPLLREYGLIAHRGFESLPLRHSGTKCERRWRPVLRAREWLIFSKTNVQDTLIVIRYSIRNFSEGLEGLKEADILGLLQALRAFDGKETSILLEARARFGGCRDFLGELAALIASQEDSVSDGATWLIKNCAESGIVPGPPEIAVIVAQLDAVPSWQAALHLCQIAEFLAFTPDQARRFAKWAAQFLDHERPFLRAWSLNALQYAARQAPDLAPLAETALILAENDGSASVRARARKIRATTPDHSARAKT